MEFLDFLLEYPTALNFLMPRTHLQSLGKQHFVLFFKDSCYDN